MLESIRTKADMYRLLAAGKLGNTIPQYFSVADWRASGDAERYPMWGVRTLRPGGPCRLFCPTGDVADTVARFGEPVNISMMVDAVAGVTLWADIWDSPTGVVAYGIEYPPSGAIWRALMPTSGRHWEGLGARMLLARHLNTNSLADLAEVFERYPGHVVELSALDRCVGLKEHRNAVTWECRAY